jgi:hypothetical protein
MSEIELPRIPSELLTIALSDLKKTIDAGIEIYMDAWGCNIGKHNCSVCFAGAVMLNTGNKKTDYEGDFLNDTSINQDQYNFLDYVRIGSLYGALMFLNIKLPHNEFTDTLGRIRGWKQFDECSSNKEFFEQIESLISFLKNNDL